MGCGASQAADHVSPGKVPSDVQHGESGVASRGARGVSEAAQAGGACALATAAACGDLPDGLLKGMAFINQKLLNQDLLSNRFVQVVAEVLPCMKDIITTVAHVTMPSPGPQAAAAVFQMAFVVCMGGTCNPACLDLSHECAKLLHYMHTNHAHLSGSPALVPALEEFHAVVADIELFVKDAAHDKAWLQRLMDWGATKAELAGFQAKLSSVWQRLTGEAVRDTSSFVEKAEQEALEVGACLAGVMARYGIKDHVELLQHSEALKDILQGRGEGRGSL